MPAGASQRTFCYEAAIAAALGRESDEFIEFNDETVV